MERRHDLCRLRPGQPSGVRRREDVYSLAQLDEAWARFAAR
jgi:hypothetical protein